VSDLSDRLQLALADRYRIERELGRGGMAIVYHAQDLKHGRPVAMKVLRPELAAALGHERFLQEIKIAANLHHPHILPLYDSGEGGGLLYYVMPLAEGESLRKRLEREKQLAIDEALQVAREVADALSYAHRHGVIHRDIKPENILLESGHAVVADFGIARAIDVAGGERLTETGIALGTPTYMSPEQAGGEKDLDGRSDLYSLGCVLHEMLAGQPPFTGPTVESLVQQHLSAPPPSVTAIRPSVPGWVTAALERCLAKTPADRFNPVAQFGEAISPGAAVTATGAQSPRRTRERRWLVLGAVAAALIITIAVVLDRGTTGAIAISTSNMRPVTSEPGLEYQPAISPDGQEVAYVSGSIRNLRLALRSTGEVGGGLRLGEEVEGSHWLPRWTPDSSAVAFMACVGGFAGSAGFGEPCDWKVVGKLGGSARSAGFPWSGSRWAWSRDGKRVAFAVGDSIFAYSVEDRETELLGLHPTNMANHSLAWSPDGRLIAYASDNEWWRRTVNVRNASVWILDAGGGEPVPVTDHDHMSLSPQWLPDSRHLLFVSNRDGARGVYVIEVGPEGPRGRPRMIPGVLDPHSISVSADGRRLAYARFPAQQNVWSIPISDSGVVSIDDAVPVTTLNQVVESHDISPDGEWIVFNSNIHGDMDLYRQRLDGGSQHLVADIPGNEFAPRWSPDGTEVVFYGGTGSVRQVFVVPVEGGTPEQLSALGGNELNPVLGPVWSPDGLAIAYQSTGPAALGRDGEGRTPASRIWIVSRSVPGGPWSAPVPLANLKNCLFPDWHPDGSSLACWHLPDGLVRVSRSGDVRQRYDLGGIWATVSPHFSPDGERIYFIAADEAGSKWVWWVPADHGEAVKVVALDSAEVPMITALTVGPQHLYLTIGKYESNIWVMDLEW
jgi:Tol biopolymer transport system component